MKRKLRLTFDQLEHDITLKDHILSTPVALAAITGGNTYSNGSSIDDILAYFQSQGFIFEKGSDGNWYGSQNITLDNVTVYAHGSNSTPYYSYGGNYTWDYSMTGSFNPYGYGGGGGGGNSTGLSPNPTDISTRIVGDDYWYWSKPLNKWVWNGPGEPNYNAPHIGTTLEEVIISTNGSTNWDDIQNSLSSATTWNGLIFDVSSLLKNSPALLSKLGTGAGIGGMLLNFNDTAISIDRIQMGIASESDYERVATQALTGAALILTCFPLTAPLGVGIGVTTSIVDFIYNNW